MLKKLWHGAVLALPVVIVSVAASTVTMKFLEAQAKKSSAPAWVGHPDATKIEQPTVLSKHELISEDHTADVVAINQVWGAYSFYTDTDNGPGMASLFTPEGVDQHFWDDGHGKLIPDFGIVAPGDEGKNMTPEGPIGSGCVQKGRDQISIYKRNGRVDPLPWPAHSHHETAASAVKVSDDGQTATLEAPYIIVSVSDKNEPHFTTGTYRAFFQKTSDGWEMAELYVIFDHPSVTPKCDVNGPLPRVFTPSPQLGAAQ
jgi:hypothetical protein